MSRRDAKLLHIGIKVFMYDFGKNETVPINGHWPVRCGARLNIFKIFLFSFLLCLYRVSLGLGDRWNLNNGIDIYKYSPQ